MPSIAMFRWTDKKLSHQRLALQPLALKPAQQLRLLFFIPAGDEDQELFR